MRFFCSLLNANLDPDYHHKATVATRRECPRDQAHERGECHSDKGNGKRESSRAERSSRRTIPAQTTTVPGHLNGPPSTNHNGKSLGRTGLTRERLSRLDVNTHLRRNTGFPSTYRTIQIRKPILVSYSLQLSTNSSAFRSLILSAFQTSKSGRRFVTALLIVFFLLYWTSYSVTAVSTSAKFYH